MSKRKGEIMEPSNLGWEKPLELAFLEKKPRVVGKRVFGVVMFGDTTKFQGWTNHPFTSTEKHAKFMVELYDQFIRFRNGSGYFVKLLADGLMAVKELPTDTGVRSQFVCDMFHHADGLVNEVEGLIARLLYPRPDGFRVRIVAGDILKLEALDPLDKSIKQIDYAEYPVSLANGLLEVEKEKPRICHESALELLVSRSMEGQIKFEKIAEPSFCPEGINPEDLKELSAFSF